MLDAISVIGSLASLAGLYLTWRVYVRIRDIEKRYVRMGVLPTYMRRLNGTVGNLQQAIESKDRDGMRTAIHLSRIVLDAIHPLLTLEQGAPIKALLEKIEMLPTHDQYSAQISSAQVVIELRGEHERLKLLSIEHPWRANDAN